LTAAKKFELLQEHHHDNYLQIHDEQADLALNSEHIHALMQANESAKSNLQDEEALKAEVTRLQSIQSKLIDVKNAI